MGKALQIRQKAADSPQGLTARRWPALLAYYGAAYRNMRPEAFTPGEMAFAQGHLRILSALCDKENRSRNCCCINHDRVPIRLKRSI